MRLPGADRPGRGTLAGAGTDFRLALLGPRPQPAPAALARIRARHGERILADGRVGSARYRELLGGAGIVVSTARHEFQGLALLEAARAGARPLVPDALCYPEQYPPAYRYPPGDAAALAARLACWLVDGGLPPPVDVSAWHGAGLAAQWRDLLASGPAGAPVEP